MKLSELCESGIATPGFVFDQIKLLDRAEGFATLARQLGIDVFYSIKACPVRRVLEVIQPNVLGFSVSSTQEIAMTQHLGRPLNFVSPIVTPDIYGVVGSSCQRITFNSIEQAQRFKKETSSRGLRVQLQTRLDSDAQFLSERRGSKLGVNVECLHSF